MKRFLLATAALAAAVAVFTLAELPPRAVALDASWNDGTIPGVLHVHTNRSDGQGTPDEIAAAAAKAGLRFLVFTDHGDATRSPDPPTYRSGVLCIDGVEISTTGGHYIAIGMGAAPYPLAGESRDVVDDVRRLGGFGIAAHPDSPKTELRWTDWDTPIDGLELINPDTSWRVHMAQGGAKFPLIRALFTYPVRSSATIGRLLTAAPDLDDRWNQILARGSHAVGLAGVDTHANLVLIDSESETGRYALPVPGYEASFRVLSVHVRSDSPWSGAAAADAAALLGAIRSGQLYTTVDAWAAPAAFDFTVTNRSGVAHQGERLAAGGGPVSLHVRSNAPEGFLTTVWRGSEAFAEKVEREFTIDGSDGSAVYRVTIRDPGRSAAPPWLISNPVYVRSAGASPPVEKRAPPVAQLPLFDGHSAAGWSREMDSASLSAIDAVQMVSGSELRLRYGVTGGSPVGQYAGAAVDTPRGVGAYDRVAFTIRAEHPMRLSIQVRAEVPGAAPERWQRSIYVDATDHERSVTFDDMRPVGVTHSPRAIRENIRAIMFIVDTTNSKPGASGRIWLKNVRVER